MPRSLSARAQLRARTLLSLKPHHWFGLYLATAALLFFAASPFLALPAALDSMVGQTSSSE